MAAPVSQMYVQAPPVPIPGQQPYMVQHVFQYPIDSGAQQIHPVVNRPGPSCAYRCMLWFFWLVGATIFLGLMAIFPCNNYKDLLMYTSGIIVGIIPMFAFNKCCRSPPPIHQTMPIEHTVLPSVAYIPKIPGISVSTQTQFPDLDVQAQQSTSNTQPDMANQDNLEPPPYEA